MSAAQRLSRCECSNVQLHSSMSSVNSQWPSEAKCRAEEIGEGQGNIKALCLPIPVGTDLVEVEACPIETR